MKWRTDLEEWADHFFLSRKEFSKKKTFGCPSYYLGKRLFAFLYDDALGLKLTPDKVNEMIRKNPERYGHFNPGDGIMKNWLLITCPEASDYEREIPVIEEAYRGFSDL